MMKETGSKMLASFNNTLKSPEEISREPRAIQLTSIPTGVEALRSDSCENMRENHPSDQNKLGQFLV